MQLLKYLSVPVLVAANIVPLIGVFYFGWNIAEIILLYWSESAIIGFFNIGKMWLAKGKPGMILTNDEAIHVEDESSLMKAKIKLIPFFIIHYSIFMFVHLVVLITFIIAESGLSLDFFYSVLAGFLVLSISHGVSFFTNYIGRGEYETADIGKLFGYPYKRIILMQFAILFGAVLESNAGTGTVVIIIFGKTVFDLYSHLTERRDFEVKIVKPLS